MSGIRKDGRINGTAKGDYSRGTANPNGDEGIRTPDLRIANATLSQLSYAPYSRLIVYRRKYLWQERGIHTEDLGFRP